MAVFLGTDVPELPVLLKGRLLKEQGGENDLESIFAVATRAAAEKKQEAELIVLKKQAQCGVRPTALETILLGAKQSDRSWVQ